MGLSPRRQKHVKTKRSQRTVLVAAICSLVIIAAFVYIFYLDANPPLGLPINWRFHLSITDSGLGKNLTIPANIGVAGGTWMNHTLDAYGQPGYAPLSTRDTSGTIYVQSVKPRLFVLSEFFSIWGKEYSRSCVGYDGGNYCSTARPPVLSNGASEYCLAYDIPPLDREKAWIIIINSGVGAAQGC